MQNIGKKYWIWGGAFGFVLALVYLLLSYFVCSLSLFNPFCILLSIPVLIIVLPIMVIIDSIVSMTGVLTSIFYNLLVIVCFTLIGSIVGLVYGKIVNKLYAPK